MTTSVEHIGEHLARAFRLLDRVSGDVQAARQLLALLGWDLPPGVDDIGLTLLDVSVLGSKLDDLVEVRSQENVSDLDLAEAVAAVIAALADTIDSVEHMIEAFEATPDYLDATHIVDEFLPRLTDLLVIQLVGGTVPSAVPVGVLLGVFELTLLPADPTIFQVEHVRQVVRWDRVPPLVTDPGSVLRNVYGWGTSDFSGNLLVINLARVLEHLAADLTARSLPRAVEELLTGHPVPEADDDPAVQILVSLAKGLGFDSHDVGVSFYALRPTAAGASDGGLGVSPYTFGTDEASFQLSDSLALTLAASADVEGGLALVLRAGRDPELVSGLLATPAPGSATASFGLSIRQEATAGTRHVLFSAPGLALDAAAITVGASVAGADIDPTLTVGIEDGRLHVSPERSDGFLSSILPADGADAAIELGISWSNSAGVRFTGQAGLHTSVVLHTRVGPVQLDRLDLGITASADALLAGATVAGAVALGPLTVSLDSIGAALALRFERGNLGPIDLGVDFLPPTGVGLRVDAVAVTGGGFIRYDPATKRYAGQLQLQAGEIGITAVGLLDARLPGGAPGYALLVILQGQFPPIQVGFGFTLTAVGGLLALNRRVDVDALGSRMASGTAGRILAPEDPVRNAPVLLSDLSAVFPPAEGVVVVGPTLQLIWAELVRFDVGVFIELPGPRRIVVLGSARASVENPSGGKPYLRIRLDIVGVLDFAKQTLAFDAVLIDSHLMEILELTGGAAFRLSWGAEPYVVLTIGGFHPGYSPAPLVFPSSLTRIAMVHGTPNDFLYMRFEGYFAVTSNTVQFGASIEVIITLRSFDIRGFIGFDALVHLEPLHFEIALSASVKVRWRGRNLGGLDLRGQLSGPGPVVFRGKVCFEILWCDICFEETFTLGSLIPPAVKPVASAVHELTTELEDPANIRAEGGIDRWVTVAPATDATLPVVSSLGQAVWSQHRAPLDLLLQRFEGAPLTVAETVTATGPHVDVAAPEIDWFAPGSFAELTDADALNRRSFERLHAGVRLGIAGTDAGQSADVTVTVKQIRIPAPPTFPHAFAMPGWLMRAVAGRNGAIERDLVVPALAVRDEEWVVRGGDGSVVSSRLSQAQAHQLAVAGAAGTAAATTDFAAAMAF